MSFVYQCRLTTIAFFLTAVQFVTSCVSDKPLVSIVNHMEISDDRDYRLALENVSRSAKVYRDFESKYIIHTTYLSKNFQMEMSRRLKDLFNQTADEFHPTRGDLAFIVSIFAPNDTDSAIDNTNLWSIRLSRNGSKHQPKAIRRLPAKRRWTPLFPYIHKWSREFLVVFVDTESSPVSQKEDGHSTILEFSNADAEVSMNW